MYIVFLAMVAMNVSGDVLEGFKHVEDALDASNAGAQSRNQKLYQEFDLAREKNPEKVSRWSFMKVLREHSDLKEYYPEINPYVECYKVRPNTYAIFSPSIMPGCGDVWSYLIIGPAKALLIDTAFGLGDIRAICEHLAPEREVVCFNTHRHVDHIGGNVCFDKIYIEEHDAEALESQVVPEYMADFLLDKHGHPLSSDFNPADLMPFRPYKVIAVPDGYLFDLGKEGLFNVSSG